MDEETLQAIEIAEIARMIEQAYEKAHAEGMILGDRVNWVGITKIESIEKIEE